MAEFNVDDYFAQRSNAIAVQDGPDPIGDKYLQLRNASEEKVRQLAEMSAISTQREAANSKSWSGQLSLDPASPTGKATNLAASLYAGTIGVAGRLESAPFSLVAGINQANLSESDIAALARHEKGQATPADLIQLNRKVAPTVAPTPNMPRDLAQAHANERAQAMADSNPNSPTPLSIWKEMNKARDISRTITEAIDASSIVHQGDRDQFNSDLLGVYNTNTSQVTQGWDAFKSGDKLEGAANITAGVAKLLLGAGSAVLNNKQATVEYITENAPQLFLGAAGNAGRLAQLTDNIANAANIYNEGIQSYQANNNGALPPEEDRQKMALYAASHAASEQLGDKIGLAATKLTGKAANDAVRASLKTALKYTTGAVAEGLVSEGPTEAYQQFAEGQITGKPATGAEIFTAGVIGAASGAGLSGGGRATHEIAKLATQANGPRAGIETSPEQAKVQKAAIISGDVSALLDPKHPFYDPGMAVAALVGHSQQETTTPEQKQVNVTKAAEIVADLETQRDAAKAILATPEEKQAELDDLKTSMAAVDPADTAKIEQYQAVIQAQEEAIAAKPLTKAEIRGYQTRLSQIEGQLVQARTSQAELGRMVQTNESIDEHIANISKPVDTTASKDAQAADAASVAASAERVINLAMVSPERLDAKVIAKLAADETNALTPPQRAYLSAFARAQESDPTLRQSHVAKDIYFGQYGNKGVLQYRQGMTQAVTSGQENKAQRELASIDKFALAHQAKAEAAKTAIAQGLGTPILKVAGQWVAGTRGQVLTKEQKKDGGRVVNSGNLVTAITSEAAALNDVAIELRATYDLKFNTGVNHVQNQAQQGSGTQTTASSPAEQVAASGGSNIATQSAGATNVKPVAVVGTDVGKAGGVKNWDTMKKGDLITLYRGESAANDTNGQWWTTDRAKAESYGVVTEVTLPSEVVGQYAAKGHNRPDEFVFPGKKPTELVEKTAVNEEAHASSVNTEVTQNAESTEKTTETPTKVDSTVEQDQSTKTESTTPVVENAGALSALAQKSPEGTVFKARKLMADFFSQTPGRDGDKTLRPLVAVKDFLSQLSFKTALQYLSITELTDAQRTVLKTFKDAAVSWQDTFEKNLDKTRNPDFYYTDMMQFLMTRTESGVSLEENLKTAMSYAAFSWIAENASRSRFNTPEEINAILDREESHIVSKEETKALALVGTRQNVVANALGQRAVQALGLKAIKGAPSDLAPRLESQLGAHIFKMLMDQGILERVTVPGAVMARLSGNSKTDSNVSFQFLRLARNAEHGLLPSAASIYQDSKGTQGVLDKMFSVESALKEPSLEAIPYEQTKTKNTNQGVPSKLVEIMAHENAVPSYIRQDMWQLVNQLDDDTMLAIAGAEDLEGKQIVNIASVQATNDSLARELDRIKGFVSGMVDTTAALFFEHMVWKQQRVGIATNVVNPQASKIHRHMLYRQSWETKIARNDLAQMEAFQLRVAEGLGVKTDKQANENSLIVFAQKTSTPEIKAAVEVLVQMLRGEDMTTAKQATLLAGVRAGGEKMHSLDALMALAHEQFAQKQDSFTVQMVGEVDGVTNGPMLSHLLMGAATSVADLFGLLNRGGFYQVGNEHSQYNLWRSAEGHFDLYENTALHMTQAVQVFINQGVVIGKGKIMESARVKQVMAAIYSFTGTLADKDNVVQKAGRNIIKTPLTAMVFGSSVGSAVESMANKFVESIHAGIEDLAAGKGDRGTVITSINLLLSQSKGVQRIATNLTVDQLMKLEFKPEQIDALKWAFKNTLGKAVGQTMQQDFEVFIQQRQEFNQAAQITFELYNAVYTGLREQMIEQLIAAEVKEPGTGIAYLEKKDGSREAIHDLTAQQEALLRKQLEDMAPVMHTLMSKDSGQLNAGLYIAKSDHKLSTRPTYQGEVKFGTKFSDNNAASTKTRGYESADTAPGVAMAPMSIHSTDSAIMHNSMGESGALNIHDAKGVGVGGFQAAAKSLNESTWDAMLRYSPVSEMFASLSRTVIGLAALAQEGKLPPMVITNLAKALKAFAADKEVDVTTLVHDMMHNTSELAFRADNMKLQALEQMASIDQYALQGGAYTVTDKNRAEAAARRAELPNALSKQETEAITQLEALLAKELTGELPVAVKDIEEDVLVKQVKQVKQSPFGELGTPTNKSDPDLVEAFKENPKATAKQVIEYLYRKLSTDPTAKNRDFNLKMLKMLSKTVNPNLTINLVTSQTQATDVLGLADKPGLGWYSASGVDEAIYVTGTEFTQSNIQVEVLLHEMTHAATAYRLTTTAGKIYRAELEALLEQARQYAKDNDIQKFDAALTNVDELVAYGMTSRAFQQELLAKTPIKSTTHKGLSTALKEFVGTLARLLGFTDAKAANGLGSLIINVTALMAQSANEQVGTRNLAMATQQEEVAAIHAYSTFDIHEALADTTAPLPEAFDNHLRGLLGGIVDKLHGPFGAFKEAMRKSEASSPLDVWLKALDTGKAPFASTIASGPIPSSAQESFVSSQVEATVRAALNHNDARVKIAYNDLTKLYMEMYRTLNHDGRDFHTGDWAIATPTEKASAKAQWDFFFELSKASGDRLDHLARFAALGLANEKVNNILQRATEVNAKRAVDAKTWGERLQAIFENVLEFFHSRLMHTYQGQNADEKLAVLVSQLVDIEAKQKNQLAHPVESKILVPMEDAVKKFSEAIREKVSAAASSDFVKNNSHTVVRTAGSITRTIAGNRVDQFLEDVRKLREQNFAGQQGIFASLLQEYKGQDKLFQVMIRMAKMTEGARKDKITGFGKSAMAAFIDNGKAFTGSSDQAKVARKAVSAVFLRTGAHNLLDHYSLAEIEHLIGDQTIRDAAITDFENQLGVFGSFSPYFTKQANVLGMYKATGQVRDKFLVMNSYVISRMLGTSQASQITEAQANQAEKLIKMLVTLYALRYSDSTALASAKEIISIENGRNGENGIEFLLDLHKHLEADSLARLFQGNPTQMVHGYTSEIYDPRIDVTTANALEGADLVAQGYVKGAQISLDPADPNQEVQHLYSLSDGGLVRRVTGVFSYTGKRAKGSSIHNGYMNSNTVAGLANAATNANIAQDRVAAINDLFRAGPVPDLSQVKSSYMAPIFDQQGQPVKWRYLMSENTKDSLLKRDNRFDKVIGTVAGSIYDKATTQEQNLKAVQALKEFHQKDYALNPKGYMLVGDKSTDPEMQEIWNLLPQDTQRDIRKIWGYNGMMVRADNLDIMFGYRKLSLATMFQKDPKARAEWEKLIVYFGEALFGQKAGLRVAQGEKGWQEIVAETKDIIVVKSGVVMLANIKANMWLLHMSGVSLTDMLRNHLVALKGVTAYQKDITELERLKVLRDTGYTQGKGAQIDREILLLKDSIVRNPVGKLIAGGLMPTIVEDVDPEDDLYSYKSAATRKFQAFTGELNPAIVNVAKYVYIAHDTPLYQGLRHVTQLSDFVARYTLYQHLVNKAEGKLNHEEAIQEASDAFVNYDIPMHRAIQYSDDMGLTLFTKYFLRIQKVLAKTVKDNPARVLTGIILARYLSLGPTVLEESSMWTKIGNNPLHNGAFKFFQTVDELTTISSVASIFQTGAAAPVIGTVAKVAGLPG